MSRARHASETGHVGWLEHSIAGIAQSIERAVFTEELARRDGWLQRIDPRAKLVMFFALVLAASLSDRYLVLATLYLVVLVAARVSRVPFDLFVQRVWLGIPLFAGIVVVPSIFFVPGRRLFTLPIGPLHVAPSIPGLVGAGIFVLRVGVSVSLGVLLVLTTPWADLLKSLQAFRVPRVFVLILSMTYRYIFLFLHTVNGMFEARKSRVVARTSGGEQRRWIVTSMGILLTRAFKISNDVYAAMLARGFTGTVRSYSTFRMRPADWVWSTVAVATAVSASLAGHFVP